MREAVGRGGGGDEGGEVQGPVVELGVALRVALWVQVKDSVKVTLWVEADGLTVAAAVLIAVGGSFLIDAYEKPE